jgi:hypothetical protein
MNVMGRASPPAKYYTRLLRLEPTNGEAAARLKEVGAGKKDGP